MSVFQKSGNWFIDYRLPNGRRKREKVGTSKRLAETVLSKRMVEIAEGRFLNIVKKEKIRFEDFIQEYLNLHAKPNKKSWKSDEYNLLSLRKYFKGKYLYAFDAKDIERFKAERIKQVAPATVNRELATLKTLFAKALLWKRIQENPTSKVKFLKEPKGRLRFLEREEIARLLSNATPKIKPIIIVALFTGMRKSEILRLKWHDIDFKRDIITLLDTKNGEKREVYMNKQVKTTLIHVKKHPESPFVFCNSDGKPVNDIRKSFFTVLDKSGIKDFRFHDLRHTFASQLVMSGVDINTVRELLGHKDIRMTLRYSHLSPNYKRNAVDILGKKLDTFWTPTDIASNCHNPTTIQHIDNKEVIKHGA